MKQNVAFATLLGFNLHCYCSKLEGGEGTGEERHTGLLIAMENKLCWLVTQLAGHEV